MMFSVTLKDIITPHKRTNRRRHHFQTIPLDGMLDHRKIPVEVENSMGRSGRDVYCVTGTLEHLQAVIMKIKMKG